MGASYFVLCSIWLGVANAALEVVHQWNFMKFDFPPDPAYLEHYRPENTLPVGLEIGWDKIYMSIPRLRDGVPAAVVSVPRNLPTGVSPVVQAYPDWFWHTAGRGDINCTGFISVFRMRADRCNRLWILDAGVITSLDDFRRVCPPKIHIFDMVTDRLVRTMYFPRDVLGPSSLLTNLVLDYTRGSTSPETTDCDQVLAYVSDSLGPGIIVYDASSDHAWSVTDLSMYPDPNFGVYDIVGERFTLMDGIVGLAHSPAQGLLYYQPLASDKIYSVPTAALAAGPLPDNVDLPIKLVGRKTSQGLGMGLDPRDNSILFSPISETAVASWQPFTNTHRVLAQDPEKLQFCTEVRWVERDNGVVWVLCSRYQKFFRKTVSGYEINVRVMRVVDGFPSIHPFRPYNVHKHYNFTGIDQVTPFLF